MMKKLKKLFCGIISLLLVVVIAFAFVPSTFALESDNNSDNSGTTGDFGGQVVFAVADPGASSAARAFKGGCVYLERDTNMTMDGGSITGHSNTYGGAIYISDGATLTMTGGTITNNSAAYGGAIYVEAGGTCIIDGGTIKENSAQTAPAIYVEEGATFKYLSGEIQDNTGSGGEGGFESGKDGTDVYMGYDGYIWNGKTRTNWSLPSATLGSDVFDHTLEITDVMSKYYGGDYIDLSNNYIALMPYYKENANLTLYSRMEAIEMTVYANEAGVLTVGTAKVKDVVQARKEGGSLTVADLQNVQVSKGLSTITFERPVEVATDETIVLGKNDSTVSLYYAKNIPVNDEMGNFTVIDGSQNAEVISRIGGKYDDTLAIQVKVTLAAETPIFNDIHEEVAKYGGITSMGTAIEDFGPFAYYDESILAGKTITKIGFPVKDIVDLQNSYMDLYKMPNNLGRDFNTVVEERQGVDFLNTYRITPLYIKDAHLADGRKITQTVVNDWIYFDVNIELGPDETLAFCGNGHGIDWAFGLIVESNALGIGDKYKTVGMIGRYNDPIKYTGGLDDTRIFFDCYYTITWSFEDQIEYLNNAENKASEVERLRDALTGKRLSILGDSISTYQDYSNEWETQNSGIKDNGQAWPYYEGNKQNYFLDTENMYNGTIDGQPADYRVKLDVPTVDDTWWKATMNYTGMELCVNNSSAGDAITSDVVKKRAAQLSDNTFGNDKNPGQFEELFPDIVAIYMGINDFNDKKNIQPETFYQAYKEVIQTIKDNYAGHTDNLTIFVFTLLPSTWGESDLSKGNYVEGLEKYNEKIRQIARETEGVELVDIYNYCGITRENVSLYSKDGIHPNKVGMAKIAECFIEALLKKYAR